MAFDIYLQVFDRDGLPLEKKAGAYLDQLMEAFAQSPKGQKPLSEGIEPGWAGMMMDFGMNYLSVTPPRMTPHGLRAILFDLFPRKVSTSADEADEIIRGLQAFWTFLQREYHLAPESPDLDAGGQRAHYRYAPSSASDPGGSVPQRVDPVYPCRVSGCTYLRQSSSPHRLGDLSNLSISQT